MSTQERFRFWTANIPAVMAMLRAAGDFHDQAVLLFDQRDEAAWKFYTQLAGDAQFDLSAIEKMDTRKQVPTGLAMVPASAALAIFKGTSFEHQFAAAIEPDFVRVVVFSGGGAMFLLVPVRRVSTPVGQA